MEMNQPNNTYNQEASKESQNTNLANTDSSKKPPKDSVTYHMEKPDAEVKQVNNQPVTIRIEKVFHTSDPQVINYYNNLCKYGRLGSRLSDLIAMDAYGEIQGLYKTQDMTLDEKVELICTQLIKLSEVVYKGQSVNQKGITLQSSLVDRLTEVAKTVRDQKTLIEAIKIALKESGQLTDEQIYKVVSHLRQ